MSKFKFSYAIALYVILLPTFAIAQDLKFERQRHKEMLSTIISDIRKFYYDKTFKGIDLDRREKEADQKIDGAQSLGQISGVVAQVLLDFDDSHLFYLAPQKVNDIDYGFETGIVGDECYIEQIDPKLDAAKKGLAVGDKLLSIGGYAPNRTNLWKLQYLFFGLRPQPVLKVSVEKPDGSRKDVEVVAKLTRRISSIYSFAGQSDDDVTREAENRARKATTQYFYEKLPGTLVWRLPAFALETYNVDDIMGKARGKETLIIDLRGNGGGRVDMLLRLIANLFPSDVSVGKAVTRKDSKVMVAKSRGGSAFAGKVIVLIDGGSASASEVLARVVQLEKRGTIVGDRSAGAVMGSRQYGHSIGTDTVIYFGASITTTDLIMKDGKSIEKVGVTPDVTVLPNGSDLAGSRDVALSKALSLAGHNVSSKDAWSIFPPEARSSR